MITDPTDQFHIKAVKLLQTFVEGEDSPCHFDHHGYCQEHGWFGEPGECNVREARELLYGESS